MDSPQTNDSLTGCWKETLKLESVRGHTSNCSKPAPSEGTAQTRVTQVMQYTTYKTEYVLSGVDKHSQSKVRHLPSSIEVRFTQLPIKEL